MEKIIFDSRNPGKCGNLAKIIYRIDTMYDLHGLQHGKDFGEFIQMPMEK